MNGLKKQVAQEAVLTEVAIIIMMEETSQFQVEQLLMQAVREVKYGTRPVLIVE